MLPNHKNSPANSNNRSMLADVGETYVTQLLLKKDYIILGRNYLIRGGEIDIIARKENTVAFIEVKTRKKDYFNLSEVITKTKQSSIIRTAHHFIAHQKITDCIIRFDVALVLCDDNNKLEVKYISNAFTQNEMV